MTQNKEQKKAVVDKLGSAFKNAAAVVFVHFKGVNVVDETAMRRDLRKEGVSYTVAKKTLIRRALENVGHPTSDVTLEGEIAVAHGGADTIAAARLMHGFAKKFTNKLAIVGGIFEGRLVAQQEMQDIAMIPSIEVLRGMFVNVINAPIRGLVVALSALAQKKQ